MALDNEKSHKYPSLFRLKSRNVGGLTEKNTDRKNIYYLSPAKAKGSKYRNIPHILVFFIHSS